MTGLEYRVTARGLSPRYFHGPKARYEAYKFASARAHLNPTTWWRHLYERGSTSSWMNLEFTQPETVSTP